MYNGVLGKNNHCRLSYSEVGKVRVTQESLIQSILEPKQEHIASPLIKAQFYCLEITPFGILALGSTSWIALLFQLKKRSSDD